MDPLSSDLSVESLSTIASPSAGTATGHLSSSSTLSWLDEIAESQRYPSASVSTDVRPPSIASGSYYNTRLSSSVSPSSTSLRLKPLHEDDHASSSFRSSLRDTEEPRTDTQPSAVMEQRRARVYVACYECRSRKIRCDGAKPVCFSCHRRDPAMDRCDYDSAPKRRGRDKVPRSRARSGLGRRAPQHSEAVVDGPVVGGHSMGRQAVTERTNVRWRYDRAPLLDFEEVLRGFDPSTFDPDIADSYEILAPPVTDSQQPQEEDSTENYARIISEPSVQFVRETWWDALLILYAEQEAGCGLEAPTLTAEQRLSTTQRIFADIRAVLRASIYWASFLHLPRFFEALLEPTRRTSIQPGLVLGMLAVGAFAQSSELDDGAKGRMRAMKLLDHAHSAVQASLASNWVNIGLVQAAWFMAYFDIQGHPGHSKERCASSMYLLDSLVRLLSLTNLDADHPDAHYSVFATSEVSVGQGAIPMLNNAVHGAGRSNGGGDALHLHPITVAPGAIAGMYPGPAGCGCARYTLKVQWPSISEIAPLWEATTMWPDEASEGETQKEECRRLVWSSVMLSAGYNTYASAESDFDRTCLFIKDYRNYALLFPGQALRYAGVAHVRQDNIWNLCLRSMVLWNTSVRYRSDTNVDAQERALFATNAWLEADAIETALNQHTCDLERSMLYQIKEFLFTSRMCVSYEFRQFAPQVPSYGIMFFYREKAEAWLHNQMGAAQMVWNNLQNDPLREMSSRPLLSYWFMGHITRALILFHSDPTLLIALDTAKTSAKPLEYLMRLWPCPEMATTPLSIGGRVSSGERCPASIFLTTILL